VQDYAQDLLEKVSFVIVQLLHNFKANVMEMLLKSQHLRNSEDLGEKSSIKINDLNCLIYLFFKDYLEIIYFSF
jgi:hypothetical protein